MPRAKEDISNGTEKAWDFSEWHNGPTCIVTVIPNPGNGGAYVYCGPHHVLSDVEAIGTRITHQASAH